MSRQKKIIYQKDPDHKKREAAHCDNEQKMWECFQKTPGFLGIDRIVLKVNVLHVDGELLKHAGVNPIGKHIKPDILSTEYDVYEHYRYIKIPILDFDELTINNEVSKPFQKYCHLELRHGGINFETVDMTGIKLRYAAACRFLKHMGITLDDSPTLHTCELAFSFASNLLLPVTVRELIVSAFSGGCKINHKTVDGATSTDGDSHYIENGRYKTRKIVLYDKIAKAEGLNQIKRVWRDKLIYRLELALSQDILEKSNNISTSKLNEVTDDMLKEYFLNRVDQAIDYYCDTICKKSTDVLSKLFEEYHKENPRTYVQPLMIKISDLYKHSAESFVLDIESFCHF